MAEPHHSWIAHSATVRQDRHNFGVDESGILFREFPTPGVTAIYRSTDTFNDAALAREGESQTAGRPVVRVQNLVKRFGDFIAVDGVSFAIQPGETYGLLGPNGAGKTSIMRMLCALSPVTGGSAEVAGFDVVRASRNVRTALGVVTQEDGLDPDLDVLGNLRIHGYLAGLCWGEAQARAEEVLGFFELAERAHSEIDELSGGMRRRLAIARALMLSPQVIVLDEPSTGLDPHSRHQVWDRLAALKASGVTVLMSTHYMEEAAALCDRVAIMDRGRILDEAPPDILIERHAGKEIVEVRGMDREALRAALDQAGCAYRELGATVLVPVFASCGPQLPELAGARIARRAPTLEDVYLLLTGRGLQEE